MHAALCYWLEGEFGLRRAPSRGGFRESFVLSVANRAGVALKPDYDKVRTMRQLIAAAESDGDVYLDVIDAVLEAPLSPGGLRQVLDDGRSAWTLAPDDRTLVRRVDPTAQAAYEQAAGADDVASAELAEAWAKVYGRTPDASDAWDHAIKAVEALLIPLVVPQQSKATLGHVAGALRGQGERFAFGLDGSGDVAGLVANLSMIWPNPDRHADPAVRRSPSEQEAAGVLHLAVAVVQWARTGLIGGR